jgi:hypothetical protein
MINIPLDSTPNQSFSVRLENQLYSFTIKETKGVMSCSLVRDNVTIFDGVRLTAGSPVVPFKYMETGNFVLTTSNGEIPDFNKFGVTQFLIYLTAAEMEAIRGA